MEDQGDGVGDVAYHGACGRVLAGAAADVDGRADHVPGDGDRVEDAAHLGKDRSLGKERRVHPDGDLVGGQVPRDDAEELYPVAERRRVLKVGRRDPLDPLHDHLLGPHPDPVGEPREDRGLVRRVPALDVERLLRLGVAQALRLPKDARVRGVQLLHLREDVVAGPVKDPVDAREPVRDQALADRLDERYAAGHARLEEKVPAVAPRRGKDLGPVGADERLVCRDHDLSAGEGGKRHLAGRRGPAHQLADDVDRGVGRHRKGVGREP